MQDRRQRTAWSARKELGSDGLSRGLIRPQAVSVSRYQIDPKREGWSQAVRALCVTYFRIIRDIGRGCFEKTLGVIVQESAK